MRQFVNDVITIRIKYQRLKYLNFHFIIKVLLIKEEEIK